MHIYKREFSVAAETAFYMPSGDMGLCFEIGFPPEGRVTRVIIKQADGDVPQVDFHVNLFDRQVCHVLDESSLSLAADPTSEELAKIIPTQVAVAGTPMTLRNLEGYTYRNREGSFTVPVRKVYLQILLDQDGQGSNWEAILEALVGGEAN